MQYFKVNNKTAIEYDEITQRTRVLDTDILKEEAQKAEEKLETIPAQVSDEELLAWARVNYPQVNRSKEIESLEKTIDENTTIIGVIKKL